MEIKVKECVLDKNQVRLLIDCTSTLEDFETDSSMRNRPGVIEGLQYTMIETLAKKYLEKYETEIIDKINLNRIVKGCELEIIRRRNS